MDELGGAKFRELVLYVCLQAEGDRAFGAAKLSRLLYFIDTEAFRQHGRTVSGQEYIRMVSAPAPEQLKPALRALQHAGALIVRPIIDGIAPQEQPIALRGPDWTVYSTFELRLIDDVVRQCRGMTAKQCSGLLLQRPGWQLARPGERVPIAADLVAERALTNDEAAYALSLAALPEFKAFVPLIAADV
jgi:hypothetical protein